VIPATTSFDVWSFGSFERIGRFCCVILNLFRSSLRSGMLREMGDTYEGRIATVTEETIRNRYTAQKQREPVITFEDGWRLLPNINQRRALIAFFGPNSEDWLGTTQRPGKPRKLGKNALSCPLQRRCGTEREGTGKQTQ
jgi:hypothetical protein